MVVDLEPALLADLLRGALDDRGLAAADPADLPAHADLLLVSESVPPVVSADVVVRLQQSGQTMPAEVAIERVGEDAPHLVVVSSVDELIDLLVAQAGE